MGNILTRNLDTDGIAGNANTLTDVQVFANIPAGSASFDQLNMGKVAGEDELINKWRTASQEVIVPAIAATVTANVRFEAFSGLTRGDTVAVGAVYAARIGTDGVTVLGTTFESETADFVAGDAGSTITIAGAGAGGVDLTTTIASYTDENTVVLTDAAGTAIAGSAVWSLDDEATQPSLLSFTGYVASSGVVYIQCTNTHASTAFASAKLKFTCHVWHNEVTPET